MQRLLSVYVLLLMWLSLISFGVAKVMKVVGFFMNQKEFET